MSWRVDKDESPTLFNRMRGNLLALAGSDRRATRLRALLIDRQPPRVAAAEQSPDQRLTTQSQARLCLRPCHGGWCWGWSRQSSEMPCDVGVSTRVRVEVKVCGNF